MTVDGTVARYQPRVPKPTLASASGFAFASKDGCKRQPVLSSSLDDACARSPAATISDNRKSLFITPIILTISQTALARQLLQAFPIPWTMVLTSAPIPSTLQRRGP